MNSAKRADEARSSALVSSGREACPCHPPDKKNYPRRMRELVYTFLFQPFSFLLKLKIRNKLWLLFTSVVFVLIATQISIYAYERFTWQWDEDYALFEDECGACHSSMVPRNYAKSPEEWQRTVSRMIPRETGHEVKQRIGELLVRHRSPTGRALYRLRCGRCHAISVMDDYFDLDAKALRLLLEQHIMQNNFAVQTWEGDLIADYVIELWKNRERVPGKSTPEIQYKYQQKCGVCHSATMLYRDMCLEDRSLGDWKKIIIRMREKTPSFIGAGEVPELTEHAMMICESKKPAP